jgi:Fungal specific transcription factor domain
VAETGVSRPQGIFREIIRSRAKRKRPGPEHKSSSRRIVRALHNSHRSYPQRVVSELMPSSTRTLRKQISTPSLTLEPGARSFDPFFTLPVDEEGNSYFLLSQCELSIHKFHSTAIISFPSASRLYSMVSLRSANDGLVHAIFNPDTHAYSCALRKEDVITAAITDPALLHAALANSALALCSTRIESKTERDYHTGQAIRLVNKRIAHSSNEALSDATILTVGWLLQFEVGHTLIFPVILMNSHFSN